MIVRNSTLQAFYYFCGPEYDTDNEFPVESQPGDLIRAYSPRNVLCGESPAAFGGEGSQDDFLELCVHGDDGSEYTAGMMQDGETPIFKFVRNGVETEINVLAISNDDVIGFSNLNLVEIWNWELADEVPPPDVIVLDADETAILLVKQNMAHEVYVVSGIDPKILPVTETFDDTEPA